MATMHSFDVVHGQYAHSIQLSVRSGIQFFLGSTEITSWSLMGKTGAVDPICDRLISFRKRYSFRRSWLVKDRELWKLKFIA